MKKIITITLLVLVTLGLFVACNANAVETVFGGNEGYIVFVTDPFYYLVFKQNGNWTLIYGKKDSYYSPFLATTSDETTAVFITGAGELSINFNTLELVLASDPPMTCERVKINSYTEGGLLSFDYKGETISPIYSNF